MTDAETQIRKVHKHGSGTDRLVNAARLAALERNLGIEVKRHRNPDGLGSISPDQNKDETVIISQKF